MSHRTGIRPHQFYPLTARVKPIFIHSLIRSMTNHWTATMCQALCWVLGIPWVSRTWSLPSRCLTSSEGHRQGNRPLEFSVGGGHASCYRHTAGEIYPRSPGVEASAMMPWGKRDKATGEMGWRESFPGSGRACGRQAPEAVCTTGVRWAGRKGRKRQEAGKVSGGQLPRFFGNYMKKFGFCSKDNWGALGRLIGWLSLSCRQWTRRGPEEKSSRGRTSRSLGERGVQGDTWEDWADDGVI